MENTKYLVRPNDYHIFELDTSNNCYRSYTTRNVTYPNGNRPTANENFTYDLLTDLGFFPIEENELGIYSNKNDQWSDFVSWQSRPDGHGGIKGGTFDEYINK